MRSQLLAPQDLDDCPGAAGAVCARLRLTKTTAKTTTKTV
jgi:hypothetical protein